MWHALPRDGGGGGRGRGGGGRRVQVDSNPHGCCKAAAAANGQNGHNPSSFTVETVNRNKNVNKTEKDFKKSKKLPIFA